MDVLGVIEILNSIDSSSQISDEDVIKLMLKRMLKVGYVRKKLIYSNSKHKSAKKSAELMNEGKIFFKNSSSSTFELLKIYSQAIAHAPNDSVELARAYGNRSAILCNARLYEDSLKDIDRAMVLDYPDNLKVKLFARKAKCLLALGPKYRRKAERAVAEARRWMEKMNDADKNLQESQLKKLSKQTSFETPFEKPDNSCIVPDIVDANKQLIGASKAIELKYSEKFGRHFVATRDIKPGEMLVKRQAYASVLPVKLYYAHCWNCSKFAWTSVPCQNCVNFVFCDENCRDKAWKNYHDIECSIISIISTENLIEAEIIGMRLTIKALKEAGSIASLKKKLEAIDSIPDPLTRGFTEGKLDGSKYASIYTLAKNTSSKRKDSFRMRSLYTCANVLFAWVNTTATFGENIDSFNELLTNESIIFMGKIFMRNMNISRSNSFEGLYHQQEQLIVGDEDNDRGGILSCLISYFNHSCDPNAFMVHSGDVIGIRSIQRIKKNEQIFISYGDLYFRSSTNDRRTNIEDRFNFWCDCIACSENWGPKSSWPSLMDQSLPHKSRYVVVKAFARLGKHFEGESDITKRRYLLFTESRYISVLSELLDVLCKNVNYICAEIFLHKQMLLQNYLSNSY